MVAQQMKELAEGLAAEHGLDFSLASLAAFEKLVKEQKRSLDEATTTRWGAYLGETIRRSRPDAVRWADFATAAREIPSVATVGEASETRRSS